MLISNCDREHRLRVSPDNLYLRSVHDYPILSAKVLTRF